MRARDRLQHPVFRYSAAVLFSAAALAIWSLIPALHESPFMLFVTAVVLTTWFCGFGPGLAAAGLSLLALDYVILPPHFAFATDATSLVRLVVFAGVSLLVGSLARQRSRADLRAERVQRQMADIVESSQDAILSKDVNGIITSWNGGAERLYGYRPDEVIGKHISILAPAEQRDEFARIMAILLSGGRVQHYVTQRVRNDGKRLTVFLSVSPLRNDRGEIVGASTIAQDVTTQIRAEEALRRNEKLATAGRLAATIAHEINNPLEAIGNVLYLARRNKTRIDEYLDMAEREVSRIANIAQQTLGLVREPASPAAFNLASLLDEVLQLHTQKLAAKKISVEKRYGDGAEILGFAGELRQLFLNLITNAIDATPVGGRLRLRVGTWPDWSDGGRPRVRVTVADTGSGISPEAMTHIFEPFYTTKQDRGTGLGLWVSYNIVQKHGGSIRVRSRTQPGRCGTVFAVFLPAAVEASNAA